MANLLKIAVLFGLIHWGSTAFAAWATPSCMEGTREFAPTRCGCIKTGYRSSLIAERLLITSFFNMEGSDFHRNMRADLQSLYNRCY